MSDRLTLAELQFDAKLSEYIERERARWEAKFKTRPPSARERLDFAKWEGTTLDIEWGNFHRGLA